MKDVAVFNFSRSELKRDVASFNFITNDYLRETRLSCSIHGEAFLSDLSRDEISCSR